LVSGRLAVQRKALAQLRDDVADAVTDCADDVCVNLAAGGMIACTATGATPFYARAERYGEAADGANEGVADVSRLPTYPIDRLVTDHDASDRKADHVLVNTGKDFFDEFGNETN